MSAYPDEVATFREKLNLPNETYDVDKKTTVFKEDFTLLEDEVIAIEDTLGINPQGEYSTVAERLDNSGGGGGGLELVAEASVSGGDVNILTCSGLDLDTDKYYQIYVYVNASSSGDPLLGWRANGDTNTSNYRIQRLVADNTTVSAARTNNLALGTNIAAGLQQTIIFHLSKKAGAYTWGYTSPIPYNAIGSMILRQFGIAHVNTANLTNFSISDESGGNYLADGTKIRVFKVGF